MYLHTMGTTLVDDKIFFTSCDFNALFCMDLREKRIEYKAFFAEYAKYREELYAKQILYKNKIYFIPRYAEKIAIYDVRTEEIAYMEVQGRAEKGLIRDAFIENDCLWVIYARFPSGITKIDLATGTCEAVDIDWIYIQKKIGYNEQNMSHDEKQSTFYSAKQVGSNWWLFTSMHGYFVNYDWKRNKWEADSFEEFAGKAFAADIQEKMWMISRDGSSVLEYDPEKKISKWIEIPEIHSLPSTIRRVLAYNNYVLFIKSTGIISMNKNTCEIKCFSFAKKNSMQGISEHVSYNGKLLLFPLCGNGLTVFDSGNNAVSEYDFEWEEGFNEGNLRKYFANNISEKVCKLEDFVEQMAAPGEEKRNKGQTVGEEIWKTFYVQEDMHK